MMKIDAGKGENCRVCKHGLKFVKYMRGEESGTEIHLYKCKNCYSFYSRINYLCQKQSDISKESIEGYISNEKYLKNRVEDILSYVSKKQWLSDSGKLLDIGCGVGWSLVVAKKKGFRTYGVEPMTEASEYANDTLKLDVVNSLFKSDLFTEEYFDFIMMDQVLEHVPNPAEMIINTLRLLKPGGILFLAVPPIDWSRRIVSISLQLPISIMARLEHNRQIGKIIALARKYDAFAFPEGHINYFSTKAISVLAENCNAQFIEQYHAQKIRARCFPLLRLSTGSFFLRKY